MKKIIILICCVLVIQMLCSCSNKDEKLQEPVSFYYCNQEIAFNTASGVVSAETREGSGFHGNLTALLHSYLLGPKSNTLYSLIPSDVYLTSCEIDGNTVTIVFNQQFDQLSGKDLSIACSALLLTVHDYTGADTLVVSAKGAQLDEKDQISISMDDIVLVDTTN